VIGGRVLDSTALHDLTIGRTIYGGAFLAAANDLGIVLAVPATALQETWASAAQDDFPFLDLLMDLPMSVVEPLDADAAQASGVLARVAHASNSWNAAAAHTVYVALDRSWPVLTADPVPLRAVDPAVQVDLLPAE
jgi:hypothetical protein